jgi:predicted cupin superfamily sugar epimerase
MVSPGFDYADYETGQRDALVRDYGQFAELITTLTRR